VAISKFGFTSKLVLEMKIFYFAANLKLFGSNHGQAKLESLGDLS
jgi:hypothetical protein